MQNLRVIRRRIRSVQNTQKITRAMQMVAGAKLRRAQGELLEFRPYAQRLRTIAGRFLEAHPAWEHPLLEEGKEGREGGEGKEGKAVGLVVVSSDTGLCGTYNERVLEAAFAFLRENPAAVVVAIGKKGSRILARRGIPRVKEVLDWGGRYEPSRVEPLGQWIQERYFNRAVGSWWVVYTQFLSALRWKPVVELFLPIQRPPSLAWPERMIVEPDPGRVADELLRRFVAVEFRRILLEAFTSEHSARMIAMKNATDNAEEMIWNLTLVRNKVRQAAITKELIEVVSGAEALK